ncbi:hypothetical protein [Immundisolibacter sp.]|jgi:hypothetical protein|uniref:hypothetical protein n=1 Tax=Immundisolibacter sp. TaxID=1934948 RepID=UPI002B06E0E2|nr:hypothetical protein [Immundisolibacter sp.]MEA3219157.1 hypothetical protein [Immundisolibacter sp.]
MTEAMSHAMAWLTGTVVSVCRLISSYPRTTLAVVGATAVVLIWLNPTAASAVAAALAAVAAFLLLLHEARSFRKSVNDLHYTELDNMYLELLKMAIDKPYLRQPEAIYRNPLAKTNQEREYDIYARMIWNFLEAVADRCHNDPELKDTWYPVIQDEGIVHTQWIRQKPKGFSENFYRRFGPNGPFGDKFLNSKI